MLLKRITKISQLLALTAILFGVGAFYQTNAALTFDDDDKRGKRQDRRADQGKRGGQDKRDDREDRGNRGRDPQRDSDREARRQQEQSDRNSRQQQRQSDQNSRRQQEWSDRISRQQQWESDRNSRRQQAESDRRSRQQQAESDRRSRQQDNWGNGRSGGGRRLIEDDDRRDRNERRRNDDRRVVYAAPGVIFGQNWNVIPQYRVDDRRAIRDQQKFYKEQLKAQRRYQKDQQRYSADQYRSYQAPVYRYDNGYYANQSDYDRGSSWKSQILPVLIANIFGGGSGSFNNGFPVQPYTRANVDPYEYQYRQPTYAPAYTYGPTYDNSYNSYGYADPDPYPYNQQGFNTRSILSSLPIAEIIAQYTGENEFVSGLIGSFLSQGYDQGLIAGQNARQYGYTDAQYNDPYTYQNGSYDPYSVSIGENRRYLSEGYEQGYRDGMRDANAGNGYYDQGNSGSSDLIGVLLNSVLSGV